MWKKKPKEIHGIDNIAKHFKISSMDIWTWRRSMADKPPIWTDKAVWCCDVKSMSDWLKKHNLLPKTASIFDLIKNKKEKTNAKRQRKNAENWNRTINRQHSRDWKITDEKLRKGRMW